MLVTNFTSAVGVGLCLFDVLASLAPTLVGWSLGNQFQIFTLSVSLDRYREFAETCDLSDTLSKKL